MKNIFTFFLLLTPFMLHSQADQNQLKVPQLLEEHQRLFQFDAQQQKQVLELQQEFLEKEAQLAALKNGDYERYLHKLFSLRNTMEGSLYRLLNQQQRKTFEGKQKERAEKESRLRSKLQKQGADAVAIKEALLRLE